MDRESLDLCDSISGDTPIALARVKTWNPGDTLTAADLNAEFNNIINNPISLVSPTTGAINFQTSVAHTNLSPSAITASSGGAGALFVGSTAAASVGSWLAIGTSGQVLTISTALLPTWGSVFGSNVSVLSSTQTYNIGAGVTRILVELWGGGAGGGGSTGVGSGGGGSGGYALGLYTVTSSQSYAVTIGAGGAGGTGGVGTSGGASNFGTLTSAGGGTGGSSQAGTAAAGAGSGGDLNILGQSGQNASTAGGIGGMGGNAPRGGPGGVGTTGAGGVGSAPGGGGAGGSGNAGGSSGGAGAAGLCIVRF